MTAIEYQKEVGRTRPLLGTFEDELHMALGMSTEAGEFLDVFKKKLAYKKDIDYINLKEELGDQMWYIANFCNLQGWNMEDVMDINLNKLKARFPEKFTEEKALNRDLVKERQILEQ